jgi:hypothetical protein
MVALAYPKFLFAVHEVELNWRTLRLAILLCPTFATLGTFPLAAAAEETTEPAYKFNADLPSLPGEERANPKGAVNVDAGNITIRDRAPDNILGVRLDSYQAIKPSVALENGWLLRNDLGVGGAYVFRNDYSDLLFNGVYAPSNDVRFQMSVSQLRSGEGFSMPNSRELQTVLQTGYLASIKKIWNTSDALPEASVSVFTAKSADPRSQTNALTHLETGTLGGYMLNLAVRPTYHSKIELGYKAKSVAYDYAMAEPRQKQMQSSVGYSQMFDDCSRVNGRYSTGAGTDQVNLQFERRGFVLGMQQTKTASNTDRAIRVGYSLPLGGSGPKYPICMETPIAPTGLQALVDATTARPAIIPNQPIARFAALRPAS